MNKASANIGRVWRLSGQDVVTSAVGRYQLQFRLDVNILALVHVSTFKKNWASVIR
jgi:hypothetical protein